MSRVKITEFKAKSIVLPQLGLTYLGIQVNTLQPQWEHTLHDISKKSTYVVKVDAGVKKRAKNGLLAINVSADNVASEIARLEKKGFHTFVVEPFIPHEQNAERYLSLQRVREGIKIMYNTHGGIDIEEHAGESGMQEVTVRSKEEFKNVTWASEIPLAMIQKLFDVFVNEYMAFLEINPLLIHEHGAELLDLAVEVDSAGDYFVTTWNKLDFVQKKSTLDEEIAIAALSEKSPSSFSLQVLNKDGAVWMLLSGGGASLVIADEYNNVGKGALIGNYGEYSGAPNEDETYEYAQQILALLLKSSAKHKVLLIAGGVANFTDVSITFKGIVRALKDHIDELKKQKVGIFVRRGGPQQERGLALMRDFVAHNNLPGFIAGPELSLHEIVKKSLDTI
ncbi:MAG: succinyl-CoA synthetase subunit beta [Microgenomates bacterium OLB23]|nr:MAG: succinyl-CoA synthetase subunit beta [Microgenomates bacterium OLB23]